MKVVDEEEEQNQPAATAALPQEARVAHALVTAGTLHAAGSNRPAVGPVRCCRLDVDRIETHYRTVTYTEFSRSAEPVQLSRRTSFVGSVMPGA